MLEVQRMSSRSQRTRNSKVLMEYNNPQVEGMYIKAIGFLCITVVSDKAEMQYIFDIYCWCELICECTAYYCVCECMCVHVLACKVGKQYNGNTK